MGLIAKDEELYEKAKAWEEARKHTLAGQCDQLVGAVRALCAVLATFPPLSLMVKATDWVVDRLFGGWPGGTNE